MFQKKKKKLQDHQFMEFFDKWIGLV
jgi:hypothetical protein